MRSRPKGVGPNLASAGQPGPSELTRYWSGSLVGYKLTERARGWTSGPKSGPDSPVSSPAAGHRGSSRSNGVRRVNAPVIRGRNSLVFEGRSIFGQGRLAGSRRLFPALLIAFVPLAACDDSTAPPPVSTVEISGAGAVPLKVGDSVQLIATVRDAEGNVLTDREVMWSSSNDSIGSVSLTGLVKAIATGDVTIMAESEGTQGTADISVSSEIALESISPATLRAGETATVTGEGFSTTPSANIVRVGGERATVTEATATELEVQISPTACQVTGDVDVQVTVDPSGNAEESNVLRHPFESEGGEAFSLGVGEMELMEATSDFCLRFGATSNGEAYLIGLQSTATSVATVTPATVSAAAASDGAALVQSDVPDVARYSAQSAASARPAVAPTLGSTRSSRTAAAGRGARWQRHRRAELSLRRQEVQLLQWAAPIAPPGSRAALANVAARSAAADGSIAADVQVGDTVPIRVPKLDDVCTGYDSIATVVRHVGDHAVWLEDVDNPSGGFTSDDFKQLNKVFDDRIYETNVEYFGEPLDLDENGRIGVVTTKEVNARENVLGFVSGADLVSRTDCASSDFGELYYGRTPDSTAQFGDEYTLAEARLDAPQLIAHEFAHILQFSGWLRIEGARPPTSIWNLEGQALIAEELNGHAATGRSTGQNYGFNVAWEGVPGEDEEQTEIAWYFGGFVDMFLYYGFQDRETSVPGAPEECSWLGLEEDGNDGPCESGREVYGVPWLILRWLTDQFSAEAGGEAAFHRGLVERGSSGFQAIAELVSVPRNQWLAEWAATLYVDDRVAGAGSRLTLPSWNLHDIMTSVVPAARLRPRQRAFKGFSDDVSVRAGSTAYFCIGRAQQGDAVDCGSAATGRPQTVVRVRDALGGNLPSHMQLWIVRLE